MVGWRYEGQCQSAIRRREVPGLYAEERAWSRGQRHSSVLSGCYGVAGLSAQYEAAWDEWLGSTDAEAWDGTASDGIET